MPDVEKLLGPPTDLIEAGVWPDDGSDFSKRRYRGGITVYYDDSGSHTDATLRARIWDYSHGNSDDIPESPNACCT